MSKQDDFAPQPTYSQSIRTNEAWIAVTTVRTDPDGTKAQVIVIEPKPC